MADYIVCHKKRNAPRVHVRVCQTKCDSKDLCKEYVANAKLQPEIRTAPARGETLLVAVTPP